jgi:ABC-type multidrug transport system ATPase subunit/two-component sensor histidine kinase
MNKKIIEFKNISCNYNKVKALDKINVYFESNCIQALIGEHGAGKSSIARILCGLSNPYAGSIIIDDKEYSSIKPKLALKNNIEIVHQQLLLDPYFTVGEYLYYCDKNTPKFSLVLKKKMQKMANDYIQGLGFILDVTKTLKDLSLNEKALVAILAKIKNNPRVLILDESLDKVSTNNYSKLKKIIFDLKRKGCCVIIISHKIDWVYDISDKITIIRNGKNLLTEDIEGVGKMQIIKMAYTQFTEPIVTNTQDNTFYHLLKYNEAILENLPVNLIILNNQGILKLANKYFINSFKIDASQYLEETGNLLFKQTVITTRNAILQLQHKQEETTIFHLALKINNIGGIYNIHYSPIFDDKNKIGAMFIIYDITEYDSLQQNNSLTEKLSSVGLLSAGVAHEINNPLEIISNYLTNIKFRYSDPSLLVTIDKLSKQVDYITRIVSNLQNFSNLDKIAPDTINVNSLINEIVDLLRINARLKNIKLSVIEKTKSNIVYINENELKQVILNLIKNSFESIQMDGEVEIIIDQKNKPNDNDIVIIIRDTGTGIDNSKDYFTPFYSTKSNNGKNTGLGLSLVYGIITKYKGTVEIINREDRIGCEVIITFPPSITDL